MSKKANPTVIGVFIVAGLALGMAGLVIFSSGNLFSRKDKYILYFEGSMKGMEKGAPVQVKGVTIGSVLEVYISHNQAQYDHSSPLIIEIDETMLHKYTDRRVTLDNPKSAKELIAKGLRARLDAASFVTGVLMVELSFMPDAPPPVFHQIKPEYIEIPTTPTAIQTMLANLGKVDIQGIAEELKLVLTHLDTSLVDLNTKAIGVGATNLLASLNRTVGSPEMTASISSLHRTLDDFDVLAKNLDTKTLVQLQTTLADLRVALQGVSTVVAPDAPVQTELSSALDQLSNAARSFTELAEFMKRNPNALILGRTPPKVRP